MMSKIQKLFTSIGFQIEQVGDKLVGPFNIDGKRSHLVVQEVGSGNGAIFNFEVIGLIEPEEVRESDHLGAFVKYLLAQNWRFAAGSVEMDTDGEVRVTIELPLADGEITANQLRLIIQILGRNGSELLDKGRRVLATGEAEDGDQPAGSEPEVPSAEPIELFFRFKRMAQTTEGRASLVGLKEQEGCPPLVRIMAETALQQAIPDEL